MDYTTSRSGNLTGRPERVVRDGGDVAELGWVAGVASGEGVGTGTSSRCAGLSLSIETTSCLPLMSIVKCFLVLLITL